MKKTLIESNPELLEEIDIEKNKNIDIGKIGHASNIKLWWKCKNGHSYYTSIGSRTRINGTGCPYCKNQKVLAGFNDLETKRPDIAKEWDYEKNFPVKPNEILPGTQKKYYWKCKNGHSYYTNVANRVRVNAGCPYCKNKAVLPGYNDLATTHPELLKKWNFDKNNRIGIKPTEVTGISGKKVWWKCEKGHEWMATIAHLAYGRGCPICNCGKQTSFPEQAILYYINKIDNSCVSRYKINGKYELDIYIPDKNIGIEYDGYRFHSGAEKSINDAVKTSFWNENGVNIIRIKEENKRITKFEHGDYIELENGIYYLNDDDYEALSSIIKEIIFNIYNKEITIDIDKDRNLIYNNYLFKSIENSLASNDDLIKYYDYDKNINVKPEYLSKSSGKKVWWKCEKGHSFQETVHAMYKGKYCPYCKLEYYKSKGLKIDNINDIRFLKNNDKEVNVLINNEKVMKYWDYDKNEKLDLDPNKLLCKSSKIANWKCPICGYTWKTRIYSLTKGHFCQKCSYKIISKKKYKKVNQYTLDGKYIRSYQSVKEAREKTGVIHITDVCNNKRKQAGGYIWKFE